MRHFITTIQTSTTMRKSLVLFFFICIASAASYAQTTVDIVNKAGVDVYSIYSSDIASPKWGSDLLGDDMLDEGGTLTITFPAGYSCKVDIKVSGDAADEDQITFEDVDVCKISRIILLGDGKYYVE